MQFIIVYARSFWFVWVFHAVGHGEIVSQQISDISKAIAEAEQNVIAEKKIKDSENTSKAS